MTSGSGGTGNLRDNMLLRHAHIRTRRTHSTCVNTREKERAARYRRHDTARHEQISRGLVIYLFKGRHRPHERAGRVLRNLTGIHRI